MAQIMLARKKVILAKIETTYGVDSTPTGAANAILVRNININGMDGDTVDRNLIRPYLGRSPQIPTAQRVTMDFEVEMAGSGTAGTVPAWGVLARICGHSETISAGMSVTYAPISSSFESATIYVNVDGVLHKSLGTRGTMSASWKTKDIPVMKYQLTGLFVPVTDATAPTPVYTGWKDPLPVSNINTPAFSLHGYSAVMSELSFDMSGSIVHRSLVGGAEQVLITDRQPQGSITIEATKVADKDWWTAAKNAVQDALTITHGTTAGNKVTFSAPKAQIVKPTYSDLDGVQMLQMSLNLIPNAGNDEYALVCL